jgi:hypothetical protein
MNKHAKQLTIAIIILALLSGSWLFFNHSSFANHPSSTNFKIGVVHETKNYTQRQQFAFNYHLAKKFKFAKHQTIIVTGTAQTLRKQFRHHQLQLLLGVSSQQTTTSKINYLFLPNVLVVNQKHVTKDLTKYHHQLGLAHTALPSSLSDLHLKQKKYANDKKLLTAIDQSQIHAGIMSSLEYNYLTKKQPELLSTTETKAAFPPLTASVSGAMVDQKYRTTINNKFKKMQLNGQLAELSVKYFLQDYTQE